MVAPARRRQRKALTEGSWYRRVFAVLGVFLCGAVVLALKSLSRRSADGELLRISDRDSAAIPNVEGRPPATSDNDDDNAIGAAAPGVILFSTKEQACGPQRSPEAEKIFAEECGRAYASHVLDLHLYAESTEKNRVRIRACGDTACVPKDITLWGRVVGYGAADGAIVSIANVAIWPEANKCEWTLAVHDRSADPDETIQYKLEILYMWHKGVHWGASSGKCEVKENVRYTPRAGTLMFDGKHKNPLLGSPKRHSELYSNFDRQTRWLQCCRFCHLHAKCKFWTPEQPASNKGKRSLYFGKCRMFEAVDGSKATRGSDTRTLYASGEVNERERVKYLGGLSHADNDKAAQGDKHKHCRDVAHLAGSPIALPPAFLSRSPRRATTQLPVCQMASESINRGGRWVALAPAEAAKCAALELKRQEKGPTYAFTRSTVYSGPDGDQPSACTFSDHGMRSYMLQIAAQPPATFLRWQPPFCRYVVHTRAEVTETLNEVGITDIVLMGAAHLAHDLKLRYHFTLVEKKDDRCGAGICIHLVGAKSLASLGDGQFLKQLPAQLKRAGGGAGRAAFVLGPGLDSFNSFLGGIRSASALRDATEQLVVAVDGLPKPMQAWRFVWDSGPALHEFVYNVFDTHPKRALVHHIVHEALQDTRWWFLDSLSPTLGRPDYRAYWHQRYHEQCDSGVTFQLTTQLLHILGSTLENAHSDMR